MRVSIDTDLCQGHGRCYELAPETFGDDERGYGEVLVPDVPASAVESVEAAVRACPERAVLLESIGLREQSGVSP